MKKSIIFILVALTLILSACGTQKTADGLQAPSALSNGATSEQGGAPQIPAAPAPAVKSTDNYGTGTTSTDITTAQQRLIQQTVSLTVVVADVQKKINEINQMAGSLGGYLISMDLNQYDTGDGTMALGGTISIRVPADKLETALTQIKTGAVDVPSEKRAGQDVTSQYVDLQSQLTNLQQAEKDLQAIMDQAQNNPGNDTTTKTQDVLSVYNQIVSIRGQIEQIQGQMKYLEETTSTSAITVSLVAEQTVKPIVTGQWKPLVVANQALQSLVKFLQGFASFLINFFILVLPILIVIFGPIALILWGIVALIKRRRARKPKAA